jgi:hypothetical protein
MLQLLHFLQKPWESRYRFAGRMVGHTDGIHAVAMTKKGNYLASGGKQPEILQVLELELIETKVPMVLNSGI